MKKQWLDVEGRMTPIILPQIWNHELQDLVVTSEQNPLPTQVTGSIVELARNSSTTTISPGSSYSVFGDDYLRHEYKYRKIRLSAEGSQLNVEVRHRTWAGDSRSAFVESKEIEGNTNLIYMDIAIKSPYLEIVLMNGTDSDKGLYRLSVLGVR